MARGNSAGIDANAPRNPDGSLGVKSQHVPADVAAAAAQDAADRRAADTLLDDALTMQQADAQRDAPRPRTDAANPNMDRPLPGDGVVRKPASSRAKKRLSSQKTGWLGGLPKGSKKMVHAVVTTKAGAEVLEGVNRQLANENGRKSYLPPNTQRVVGMMDRSIAAYERTNQSEHLIYTPAIAPDQVSNAEFADELRGVAQRGGRLRFERYVVADHSITRAKTPPGGIVWEWQTRRGAYLGASDSNPNGTHITSRGVEVEVVGVRDVTVQNPDGSTYTQTVAQIRDVTDPNERTAARG